MKFSRRGLLAGLLAAGAVPVEAKVIPCRFDPPPPKLPRGYIVPRVRHHIAASHVHMRHYGIIDPARRADEAVCIFDYEVFDGEKFVRIDSQVGERLLAELR